jgi:hypothetical protein
MQVRVVSRSGRCLALVDVPETPFAWITMKHVAAALGTPVEVRPVSGLRFAYVARDTP